jgi:hypothetical protein
VTPTLSRATERVTAAHVEISADPGILPLSPLFLGLSYETRAVLPADGKYYFDPGDDRLVRLFQTLGVKSLRIGGNAVDDPRVPVPGEKDIDSLFRFARSAKVKVIYSFRLRDGDPVLAAKLASYIATHYADCLDCFCIGNEPDHYLKTYREFLAAFEPEYAAILKAVPSAQFEGPAGADWSYALPFADEFFPRGHLKMVSAHTYPLGAGRAAEQQTALALRRFLSAESLHACEKFYRDTCAPLAAKNIPYRMDEANSCWDGGAKGSSDAFASALWGFDFLNWWAMHQIVGVNFHTGDTVNGIPPLAANYAVFTHNENGDGFVMRPLAFAMLAFKQIAAGKPLMVRPTGTVLPGLSLYAYGQEGRIYVALINRSYGTNGQTMQVSLQLSAQAKAGVWERMDLAQQDSDVAATSAINLGGAEINADCIWNGVWRPMPGPGSPVTVTVGSASVALLRFTSIP